MSDKVEIFTKSYKEGSKTVRLGYRVASSRWRRPTARRDRGTTIVLHLSEDSLEYAEDAQVEALLKKYCRFLPVPIAFGKVKEWKDGKYVDTDKDNIINNVEPLWTRKPADITERSTRSSTTELYPDEATGRCSRSTSISTIRSTDGHPLLPEDSSNFEIRRTDPALFESGLCDGSGRGIVPEYLTLLLQA